MSKTKAWGSNACEIIFCISLEMVNSSTHLSTIFGKKNLQLKTVAVRAFVVSDVPLTLGEEHKDQVKRRLVPALKSLALHNAVLHSARHWLQTSRSLRPSASILFHPTMHL